MRRFASVNAWIVGTPGRQAIVDTGMPGEETAELWRQAEASGGVGGVAAVVCTHMHRDHTGQAPALLRRHRAALHMSAREHERLLRAAAAPPEQSRDTLRRFLFATGMAEDAANRVAPIDYAMLSPFPADFRPLEEGAELTLGGMAWQVLLGGGHSAQGACLLAMDGSAMITGDQILPGAGPHIAVWAGEPEADPLAEYFRFLDRLAGLPDELLVLPGHGAPFRGVAGQAAALRQAHARRLERLRAAFGARAMSCVEMAPLVFSDRARARFGELAPGMTLALANHLWHRGELRRRVDVDGVYRFSLS